MKHKLYISAVGMLTPVGADLAMTTSSVAAGINVYAGSPYLDQQGEAIKMALVPNLALPPISPELSFYGRYSLWHKLLLRLGHGALMQALDDYKSPHAIPLILNVAEQQVIEGKPLPDDFIAKLAQQSQSNLNVPLSRILYSGRAGAMEALALAEKFLFERDFDEVLIGGIDSYQLPSRLKQLMAEQRLAAAGVMDGFTPGEGACFIRLSRHREHSLFGGACLSHAQIASEAGHLYSDGAYLGDGLATAVGECCASNDMPPANKAFISANGERYWAKELGTALIRNQDLLAEEVEVVHPSEFYGDLGAAAGLVLIALAANAYKPQETQLICASSDFALRGAVQFGQATATTEPTDTRGSDNMDTTQALGLPN